MTKTRKYFYIAPALLYYAGIVAYFVFRNSGAWINTICITALLLLVQIVVCMLAKRRSPLAYSFSYIVPTSFCVSAAAFFADKMTMHHVWIGIGFLFAIIIIVGSRVLKAIPRNTTALWMGSFIMLVIFTFLAGLLSVL